MIRHRRIFFITFGILVALGFCQLTSAAAETQATVIDRIDMALRNITALTRTGKVGYATFWDRNKYIQCRRLTDRTMHCEAAGRLMQPSLERVLTPARVAALDELGWRYDPNFGNFRHDFPPELPSLAISQEILKALIDGYDVKASEIETETNWVDDLPCPPRNGPSQNLAGMINDAPSMRAYAIHTCSFTPDQEFEANKPAETLEALEVRYKQLMTAELQRLRINAARHVFVVFDAGIGYVQCAPEATPPSITCEAQSAESWPALSAILTTERIAMLHDAGFADPGESPNYSKDYAIERDDDATIAHQLLSILYNVYGYKGVTKLKIKTEQP